MNVPTILFLEPNRVWRTYLGGMKLDQMEGKQNPIDTHFPEDWIGSTTCADNKERAHLIEEGLTKVCLQGKTITLKTLCEKEPMAMLGAKHFEKYGANTQFLLKFLDSAIRLHIQCHPTVSFAQKYLNSSSGKTEAYIILAIREDVREPYIYAGFQNLPTSKKFKKMVEEQDNEAILSCFEKVPIKPGDVFIIPGGMPHAIGEGVLMIEVMEPTDFTVRIEFERGGYVLPEASRFMNRDIDFALSMFNFEATSVEDVKKLFFCKPKLLNTQNQSAEYALIDKEKTLCFSVNRLDIKDYFVKESQSFYMGIVTKGTGTINIEAQQYPVKEGSKFFIPYQSEIITYETESFMEVILVFPPE